MREVALLAVVLAACGEPPATRGAGTGGYSLRASVHHDDRDALERALEDQACRRSWLEAGGFEVDRTDQTTIVDPDESTIIRRSWTLVGTPDGLPTVQVTMVAFDALHPDSAETSVAIWALGEMGADERARWDAFWADVQPPCPDGAA